MSANILASVATMLWTAHRYPYPSFTIWLIQSSEFLYPLLLAAIGLVFTVRWVKGRVPQLFWAAFLAAMAIAIFTGLRMPLTIVLSAFHFFDSTSSQAPSWWQMYGIEFIPMLVVAVVYLGTLVYLDRRRK
jgi:hypothetical protein